MGSATIPPPAPPRPPACHLILKNGVEVRVDGISVSWAKHVRRTNGELRITHQSGQKLLVMGKDIEKIVPLTA